MNKTYLGKLFQEDRRLFLVVAGIAVFTVLVNLVKLEITPFFLWGMYSEKEATVQSYTVLETRINRDSLIDLSGGIPDNTRFFLSSPVWFYKEIKENGNIDPNLVFFQKKLQDRQIDGFDFAQKVFNGSQQMRQFPGWYKHYLSRNVQHKIDSLQVKALQVHYDENNRVVADAEKILFVWP